MSVKKYDIITYTKINGGYMSTLVQGWISDVAGKTINEVIEYFQRQKEEHGGEPKVHFLHYGDEGHQSIICDED